MLPREPQPHQGHDASMPAELTTEQIVRAWRDSSYRDSLSADLRIQVPESPVGEIDFRVPHRSGLVPELFAGTSAATCSTAAASCSTAAATCSTASASCSTASADCSTAAATCSTASAKCSTAAATCSTAAAKCSTAAATCSTAAASCSTAAADCGPRRRRR